jgi:hypothetical protein
MSKLVSFSNSFVLWFGLLQVRVSIVLEPPDHGLELFGFSSYSWGGFSVTHTRCSVKYVWDLELLVDSILFAKISHETLLASVAVFRCVSSSLAWFWGPLAFRLLCGLGRARRDPHWVWVATYVKFLRGILIGSHSPPPLVAFSGPLKIQLDFIFELISRFRKMIKENLVAETIRKNS